MDTVLDSDTKTPIKAHYLGSTLRKRSCATVDRKPSLKELAGFQGQKVVNILSRLLTGGGGEG